MKKQMHLAAQYLAAAGISFLEKKADDSHTNLGFDIERGSLETHLLSDHGDQLFLNYVDFSLEWKSKSSSIVYNLDGSTHEDVLKWITETARKALNKTYSYNLHYDLPYKIDSSFTFKLEDPKELVDLKNLRTQIQLSLEQINADFNLNTSIRVWPHHFDSGIYTKFPDSDISIGFGLAIPDTVSPVHYFYISGYNNNGQMETANYADLSRGKWSKEGFKGAILPAAGETASQATTFFKEAIQVFLAS
ncbi:hypothetical protein [Nonlabens sp. Asnod2-A12]|uniref:hypothetical protein n=1 Tax=Nonlabens sp. Asnod2-A12 TaxID=3160578 RepID=UPI00386D4AE5